MTRTPVPPPQGWVLLTEEERAALQRAGVTPQEFDEWHRYGASVTQIFSPREIAAELVVQVEAYGVEVMRDGFDSDPTADDSQPNSNARVRPSMRPGETSSEPSRIAPMPDYIALLDEMSQPTTRVARSPQKPTPLDGIVEAIWPTDWSEVRIGPVRLAGGLELLVAIVAGALAWLPGTMAVTYRLVVYPDRSGMDLLKVVIGWGLPLFLVWEFVLKGSGG